MPFGSSMSFAAKKGKCALSIDDTEIGSQTADAKVVQTLVLWTSIVTIGQLPDVKSGYHAALLFRVREARTLTETDNLQHLGSRRAKELQNMPVTSRSPCTVQLVPWRQQRSKLAGRCAEREEAWSMVGGRCSPRQFPRLWWRKTSVR